MSTLSIILLSLLIVLLAGTLWLLLAPIRLTIDSNNNIYKIDYHGVASISALPKEQDIDFRLSVLFWKKNQTLTQLISSKKKATPKSRSVQKKSRKKIKFRTIRNKIFRLLKSFRVKEFSGTIDTDDYVKNAFLYPAFYWIGARKGRFPSINFIGRNEIKLVIENRLIRILYAWIRGGRR